MIFTGCAILGFALLNACFVYEGEGRAVLLWTSGGLFGVAFLASWLDMWLRSSPGRLERERETRERLLHDGMVAYVRSDLDGARLLFRECLRIDPLDVEALFRLGASCARAGDRQAAERWLAKLLRHDLEEKWSWEAHRELAWLREGDRDEGQAGGAGGSPREIENEEETEPASA